MPDFGYPIMLKDNDDEGNYMRTWDLFLDLIQHGTKYERVENFIQAKHYEIKAERKEELLQWSLGAMEERHQHESAMSKAPEYKQEFRTGKVNAGNKSAHMRKELFELIQIHKDAQQYL